ncbi:MAG: hypothetical protein EOO77_05260 [Oxalobacteraceae bacterium]|nr:MAG: hypothetical protein EOO77_05260 [Oxalobacteraceae bacterium]
MRYRLHDPVAATIMGAKIARRSRIVAKGDMADRVRAFNWATTSLGGIEAWPERLAAAVEAMLAAPQLATLAIGPERIFLYNDEASRH